MYVARVYVGGMMPTVENIEVADTDWVEANSRSVKDYVFVPYSSGEEVSLGAGTWIADGQNPPLNGHFVATQVLTASDQQLILNETDRYSTTVPGWADAAAGDTLTLYATEANSARYMITGIENKRGAWTVDLKLIEGRGTVMSGQRHEMTVWSRHGNNLPTVGGRYDIATKLFEADEDA